MPLVTLLTGADSRYPDPESPLLKTALEALGVASRVVSWADAEALAEPGELVVIRSTWDYHTVLDAFLIALGGITAPLANPLDVVTWNSHKGYLVELAAAGVPVVPTRLYRQGDRVAGLGTGEVVIKPAVSVDALGAGRFDGADPAARAHLADLLTSGDALLQPFQPQVVDGERSLIYLGGKFSHAVRKTPAPGDYRVQENYGGTNRAHVPSAAELTAADAALARVTTELLYARVDLVPGADGPLLMELELIEPYLFLRDVPGSAERFAAAIAARLG